MIEISGLNKTFQTANGPLEVLRDINLTIEDGEIFGIIGLSGAGKSTLVRCINQLERPTTGTVIIDGKDMTKLAEKELLTERRSIGMIFQSFNLLEQRNVLKNVCFPMEISGIGKKEAEKRAMELLEMVKLSDRAKSYPSQLSGGQKQRVAIARAMATRPRYLLCDEATSALDTATTQSILDILKEINEKTGVTVIVITHEMKVIDQICDRVAVLDKSRIVEIGEVSKVFTNPQSDIAKELILPQAKAIDNIEDGEMIRIVFNGEDSSRPVISNLVLECRVPVNIMFADTKVIDGKVYGHMLLQLPDRDRQAERVRNYLDSIGIDYSREG